MRVAWLVVLIAVLAAACGSEPSGAPSPTPAVTSPTSTPVSPSPTAASTPTPDPSPGFLTRAVEEPVIPPADGERYTNPGAVLEIDGTLHLLRNSFSRWPGDSTIHHLTSTDGGVTWELADPEPVLTNADVPYADQIAFVTSAVIEDDGSWTAYLYTYDGTLQRAVIGRATAPGPGGPWAVDPEPVLEPGEADGWDGARLAEPSVVRVADGYRMWFTGFETGGVVSAIGSATSPDGITWTKHDGPVLTGDEDWTLGSIAGPQVVPTEDGYLMTYMSAAQRNFAVGAATSPDGLTWTPLPGNPVLDRDDTGSAFFQSELFRTDGRTRFLLEIGSGSESTNLFLYDVRPEPAN